MYKLEKKTFKHNENQTLYTLIKSYGEFLFQQQPYRNQLIDSVKNI